MLQDTQKLAKSDKELHWSPWRALHLGKTVSNALSPISPKSFPPEFSRRQDAADLLKPSILEPHTPNHETLKPAALEN